MKINILNFLENLVILFALFPYVSFGIINTDSQPWIIIVLFLYFLTSRNFSHISIISLWLVSISILLTLIIFDAINSEMHFVLRALISYSIFFLAWFASCKIHSKRNPIIIYLIASWIYIIGGLLQLYSIEIFDWMSPNRDGGRTRGVTSFTPEPTYLGIVFFLLIWILYNSINKKNIINVYLIALTWLTILCNLAGIILIAQSTMVALWVIFSMAYLVVMFFNIRFIILSPLILSGLFLYVYNFLNFEKWRIFILYDKLLDLGFEQAINIIHYDWSINVRVANVIFPIIGVWQNGFFPGGIQSYGEMSNQLKPMWNYFFNRVTESDKIWSFVGTFVYELGFFGIIILFLTALILKFENKWTLREIILIGILLLSCVPLGVALVPLLFGSKLQKEKI